MSDYQLSTQQECAILDDYAVGEHPAGTYKRVFPVGVAAIPFDRFLSLYVELVVTFHRRQRRGVVAALPDELQRSQAQLCELRDALHGHLMGRLRPQSAGDDLPALAAAAETAAAEADEERGLKLHGRTSQLVAAFAQVVARLQELHKQQIEQTTSLLSWIDARWASPTDDERRALDARSDGDDGKVGLV